MADYTSVPQSIPSPRRTALISNVAVGDQVDIIDVLGRPARGVKFEMTATTDIIDYKLNNLVRLSQKNEGLAPTEVLVWSAGAEHSTFQSTGQTEYVTAEGLLVDSFEILAMTLSSGTTINVVVW